MLMKLQQRKKVNLDSLFIKNQNFKILKLFIKILFYLTIGMSIKVNGMRMIAVVEECKYGKMGLFMRGIGKITLPMGMED